MRARRRPSIVVVGGGISGLTAAHHLATAPEAPRVTLVEASGRLGGWIADAQVAGVRVDAGPDSVLARVPWGTQLLTELGLDDQLVTPAPIGAHLFVRGALRPLPAGLMTGHATPAAIRRAGLLSRRGQLRAAIDLVLPGGAPASDESIGDAIGERFGHEAVAGIADPLIGGVYAGDAQRLSLRAAAPAIAAARARGGSLLRAMRSSPAPDPQGPVFVSLRDGLARLPEALHASLERAGASVLTDTPALALQPAPDGVLVALEGRSFERHDAVVLATPAAATAALLAGRAPSAARRLRAIRHASVALVALAYRRELVPARAQRSSGFLVGRREELEINACTLSSSKWPQLAPDGPYLLRCSFGRIDRPPSDDDEQLVAWARRDLARALGIADRPLAHDVTRFERALPQHEVGHLDRLVEIEADVARAFPNVALAGAWTRGIGIAACIREGREAAQAAMIAAATSRASRR